MHWYEIALLSLVLLVAALLLLIWHVRSWERRLAVALKYGLEEKLRTPDGADIELRRLPLPPEPVALPPVLVVHGLGANHRNNDLTEDISLARYLGARGRDVWLLTLRSGLAQKSFAAARRVRFAAMARHDVPIAIREVLDRTGSTKLDYVGFSMGGMLLYAALANGLPPELLRRVAIVGSPGVVRPPVAIPVPAFVSRIPALVYPTLRFRLAARAGAFAAEWFSSPAHRWVFNPRNVARGVARLSLVNVVMDVPGPLNYDFALFAASPGGRITLDGTPVLDELRNVSAPAIFFAGCADRLAPPDTVRAAFDAWGSALASPEKRFVLLGVEHGHSADYGHGDLCVGANVRTELFEPLAEFLSRPEAVPEPPVGSETA